jgi:hypothetical protein
MKIGPGHRYVRIIRTVPVLADANVGLETAYYC